MYHLADINVASLRSTQGHDKRCIQVVQIGNANISGL
jgi:hypothetical protein